MTRYFDQDGTLLVEHTPGHISAVLDDGELSARSVPIERWEKICGPLVQLPTPEETR